MSIVLLQTCAFDVSLINQGAPVSAVTLKVECSVEGGSTAVLYDNSQSPLQHLAFNAEEQLRVQTDIKEQGLITIVASAVFTGELFSSCHASWHLCSMHTCQGRQVCVSLACDLTHQNRQQIAMQSDTLNY